LNLLRFSVNKNCHVRDSLDKLTYDWTVVDINTRARKEERNQEQQQPVLHFGARLRSAMVKTNRTGWTYLILSHADKSTVT
jgi:hypothetical protein